MSTTQKAVKNSSPTNLDKSGFSSQKLKDVIFKIKLPENVDPNRVVDVYGKEYLKLCSLDPDFNLLQMSYSRLARLKGTILNILYHIKSDLRGDSLLTQKQYTEFRKNTAKNLMIQLRITKISPTVTRWKMHLLIIKGLLKCVQLFAGGKLLMKVRKTKTKT